MNIKTILLFVLVIVAGCAAKGSLYTTPDPPPDGYARVVIYRPGKLVGAAYSHSCYIEGTLVAELRVRGYTTLLVKPGFRLFHYHRDPDIDLLANKIDLEAGNIYYIKEEQPTTWFFATPVYEIHFSLVPPDQAAKEIRLCRYQPPVVDVFDGDKSSALDWRQSAPEEPR